MLGVVLVFYLSLHFLAVDSISNYSNGTEPEQIHLAATGGCLIAESNSRLLLRTMHCLAAASLPVVK